ncbi:leucyl aminopeptidase [Candidatus Woesearchaeota archaeon]|nr:leucyl aminopeptidase [Candidatus Woesearchaeota archaeon]
MHVEIKQGNIEKVKTDLLIIPIFKGFESSEEIFKRMDRKLNNLLSDIVKEDETVGDEDKFTLIFTGKKIIAERILLAGLGDNNKFTAEKIRKFGGKTFQQAKSHNIQDFCLLSFGYGLKNIQVEEATQALAEGLVMGSYAFDQFKTKKNGKKKEIKSMSIFPIHELEVEQVKQGIAVGNVIGSAVNVVRDMINKPANIMTPTNFANEARIACRNSKIKCKILGKVQLKKEKMNLVMAVGQGSVQEPKMVILEYKPGKKYPFYALIGKGVTYDSGGLNLKPGKWLAEMKDDKGGAAAIVGAMVGIAKLKLPVNLIGILPCAENMPDGNAVKPGDILKSASGKTVEILNTDAEGRLLLADALYYASKLKPEAMIDIASLTGACIVALGYSTSGVFGTDQALIQGLLNAGEKAGEKAWQLPLDEEHTELIKADNADIRNLGGDDGLDAGASTAAAFLKEFTSSIKWAHIDIGGTVYTKRDLAYCQKGATGAGTRLLIQFFRDLCNGQQHH